MTYNENELIKLIGSIYDIHRGPNEYFPYDGFLIKNNKNIDSLFLKNFQNEYIQKETKEEKNNLLMQKLGGVEDKQKEKYDLIPSIYNFEEFQNNGNGKNKLEDFLKKINFFNKIEEAINHIQFIEKKRRSPYYENDYDKQELMEQKNKSITNNIDEKTIKIKRGRKPEKHKNIKTHDKMKPDNIIKKIKIKIYEYAILFLNTISNKNNEKEKLLIN